MTELAIPVSVELDVATVRQYAITAPPEEVAASVDAFASMVAAYRAAKDAIAWREALRRRRLIEWEMAHRWPAKPGGWRDDDRPVLTPRGVKDDIEAWQKVYGVGRADIDVLQTTEDIADLFASAFRTKDAHVGANSGVPEWYTPADLIDAARDVLGSIDLDPASSPLANETVKAERYYTVDDDGLTRPWAGQVWMNPPYTAGLVDRFVAKLLDEFHAGNVTAALVLTNNSTDTRWWQSLARRSRVCCLAGRVRFLDEDGNPGVPLQGQTVCYLGDDTSLFTERFDEFGVVL
jgi:DNA N-6-adenine-methyltransferase (Dam)